MKQIFFFLIGLLLINQSPLQAQIKYNKDITPVVITFDQSCMQRYDYTADKGYIVEADYTNIHMPIDENRILILKIFAHKQPITNITLNDFEVLSCDNAASVASDFVARVNTKATELYFAESEAIGKPLLYQVDMIFIKTETSNLLSYYGYPFTSFSYDYTKVYYPTEELYPLVNEGNTFETRIYYHGLGKEQGHERHEFLKMYRDACAKRSAAITTDLSPVGQINPAKEILSVVNGEPIYRSCQHPIIMEVVPGIGVIREAYEEDGTFYRSRLEAIDGIPINDYLVMLTSGESSPSFAYTPAKTKQITILAKKDNRFREPDTPPFADEIKPKASKSFAKIESGTATKLPTELAENIHIVKEGDTLYNLSKKYNTSIDKIQRLNNLTSEVILVEQRLRMR